MTVSILNTTVITVNAGTPSANLTPSASASHLAVAVSYTDFDGTITGISLGGNALTRLVFIRNATNNEANAEIWYLPTPSNTSQAFVITGLGTWKDVVLTCHSLSGSGTPVTTNTDTHSALTNLNAAVSCAVGDFVIAAASSDRTSGIGTWANSFTSDVSGASPNSLGTWDCSHKIAASTTETANIQMASGSGSFSAALAVGVFPSSGGGSSILLPQLERGTRGLLRGVTAWSG